MSKRRKQRELHIRVIGAAAEDSYGGGSDTHLPHPPQGSTLHLSLEELLQSRFTDEYADAAQPLWIQIENASHAQLERIGEHFGLHPLTVEAVQTRHTREKLEIFSNYLFLVFHALHTHATKGAGAGGNLNNSSSGSYDDWTVKSRHDLLSFHRVPPATRDLFHVPRPAPPHPSTLNPFDISREQAEALAAASSTTPASLRSPAQSSSQSRDEPLHEGSSLLNNQATRKYYGGSGSVNPSPALPRRHKSSASLQALQHPGRSPSPGFGSSRGLTPRTGVSTASSSPGPGQPDPSSSSSSSSAALAIPVPAPAAARTRNLNLDPQLWSGGGHDLRMFPDQTLMPGSPQSAHSSATEEDEDDEEEDDEDEDDDEDSSTTDSDTDSVSSEGSSRNDSLTASSHHSPDGASALHSALHERRALRRAEASDIEEGDTSLQYGGRHVAKHSSRTKKHHHQHSSSKSVPAISAATAASLLSHREPLRTTPIKLVVFPHMVLSFHSSNLSTVTSVARRLERVYHSNVESAAWVIHALLDSITDSLLPVVNGTATEVDALEELIYVLSGSEHRDLLKRMGMTRRKLSFLRQRLWSKRDILMSLIGKDWQVFLSGGIDSQSQRATANCVLILRLWPAGAVRVD
jgi:Mg2+ and Co2+ transporter CorA